MGKNTIFFISKKGIFPDCHKDVTHGKIVCEYREGKAEPNRKSFTVGEGPNKLP